MSNKLYYKGKEYGGGDVKPINADKNQVLVGDGEDWAEGSPFYSYEKEYKISDQQLKKSSFYNSETQQNETIDIVDFYIKPVNTSSFSLTKLIFNNKTHSESSNDYIQKLGNLIPTQIGQAITKKREDFIATAERYSSYVGREIEYSTDLSYSLRTTLQESNFIIEGGGKSLSLERENLFSGTYDNPIVGNTSWITATTLTNDNISLVSSQIASGWKLTFSLINLANPTTFYTHWTIGNAKTSDDFTITIEGTGEYECIFQDYVIKSVNGKIEFSSSDFAYNEKVLKTYGKPKQKVRLVSSSQDKNDMASLTIEDNSQTNLSGSAKVNIGGQASLIMDEYTEAIMHGAVKLNLTNYKTSADYWKSGINIIFHDNASVNMDGNSYLKIHENANVEMDGNIKLRLHGGTLQSSGECFVSFGNAGSSNKGPFIGEFASGFLKFTEDDVNRKPALFMQGGSAIIMNANSNQAGNLSKDAYDPLIMCSSNELIFIGQGSGGAYTSTESDGTPHCEWKNGSYPFTGPGYMTRDRNPRLKISDSVQLLIGGAYDSGTTYMKIEPDMVEGSKITYLISGRDVFTQRTGTSHVEMHDDTYLAMKNDLYGQGVFRFGSTTNNSSFYGPPAVYCQPFTMRKISNAFSYLIGAQECSQLYRISGSDNRYISLTVQPDTTQEVYIKDISLGSGSIWTENILKNLLNSSTMSNSYNSIYFPSEYGLTTYNNKNYVCNKSNTSQRYFEIELITSPSLILRLGALQGNYSAEQRYFYIRGSDTQIGAAKITFSNVQEDFSVSLKPISGPSSIIYTQTVTSSQPFLETSYSTPIGTPNRNNYLGLRYDNFIGMESLGGIANTDSYTDYQGLGTVFGTSARLGTQQVTENYGFIAFGHEYGITAWGGNQSNISLRTTYNEIVVKDSGGLTLAGSAKIEGNSDITDPNNIITSFTFKGGTNEEEVTFTLKELKALKQLLSGIEVTSIDPDYINNLSEN